MIQSLLLSQSDCEGGAPGRIKCLLAGIQINSAYSIHTLSLSLTILTHTHRQKPIQTSTSLNTHRGKAGAHRYHKQDLVAVKVEHTWWLDDVISHYEADFMVEETLHMYISKIFSSKEFLGGQSLNDKRVLFKSSHIFSEIHKFRLFTSLD